ncbi:uncharacterized protein BX664DRAFT_120244 [Halteromyces radiatus]|uniref:uncharacterized protein n=1 Tax=Halteromyces radiatus TaxID=101107 RepID=UPI002220EF01|nr:uncharacterized protein BX664DRAFT_120244 [Halteromyces radiatus]KAI8088751.1 hypothetical protein BX664DRAFT_120244 [Halteromyces radiatus]
MKLPSIHSLLNPPPSPPTTLTLDNNVNQPPSVQIFPASPMENSTLSPMLSPALSSSRSPSISSVGSISPVSMNLSEFPPIHGDDPPRRLVHSTPTLHPRSPSHYLHHHRLHSSEKHQQSWSSNCYSKDNNSTPPLGTLPTPPHSLSPPPSITISPSSDTPKIATIKSTKEEIPAPPPCTQIFISPTGQPILKRRRGRPPTRSPGYDEGGWTFLSPTVWDVTSTTLGPHQHERRTEHEDDGTMNESMAAFTSANMDTVLPMPKKKRGRKPKTHIEGNSCFVWKDISAARRTAKTP